MEYCHVEIWKLSRAKKGGKDRLIETFRNVGIETANQIAKHVDGKHMAKIIKVTQGGADVEAQ